MKSINLIGVFVIAMLLSGCIQQTQTETPVKTNAVEIKDFEYNPVTITVSKGMTVTWTQLDIAPHTVTSVPIKDETNQQKVLNSTLLSKGQTYSYIFNETGTFEYYCAIHPSMKGKVIVT